MMNKYAHHFDYDIMISGFEIDDKLMGVLVRAVSTAVKEYARADKVPIVVKNADDDFFGNSVNILL